MAQKTDTQLSTSAGTIKNETTAGANSAIRVGGMLEDLIDSKINIDKIDTANSLDTANKTIPGKDAVLAALNNKVDKNGTDRLMTAAEGTKLAGINNHYRGTYLTLSALQTAIPTGNAGDEAIVDAGVGSDPQKYIWDSSDNAWKVGSSSSTTVDQAINSGSVNAVAGGAVYTALQAKQDTLSFTSQSEAEGNTENTKVMTALRVFQNWLYNITNYTISALNTTSKTVVGAINELFKIKPVTGVTFSGEINISDQYQIGYLEYSLNTSLTPTLKANPLIYAAADLPISAGVSASLNTSNMGSPWPGSDSFTPSKQHIISIFKVPGTTDNTSGLWYYIKVLN